MLWASTEWSKPESEEQTVQNWSATKEVGLQVEPFCPSYLVT